MSKEWEGFEIQQLYEGGREGERKGRERGAIAALAESVSQHSTNIHKGRRGTFRGFISMCAVLRARFTRAGLRNTVLGPSEPPGGDHSTCGLTLPRTHSHIKKA